MREYGSRHRRKNPNRLLGQLPPDQAKAILGGEVPAQRPIGVRMADLADDDAAPLFARAAAAAAAQAKPIQLAQADTGTMTDAAPAIAPQPQTAKPAPSAGSAPAQGQGIPAGTQANAGGATSRDYGAIADEFGLDRGMGKKALNAFR